MNRDSLKYIIRKPYIDIRNVQQQCDLRKLYLKIIQRKQLLQKTLQVLQKQSDMNEQVLNRNINQAKQFMEIYLKKNNYLERICERCFEVEKKKKEVLEKIKEIQQNKNVKLELQLEKQKKKKNKDVQRSLKQSQREQILIKIQVQKDHIQQLKQRIQSNNKQQKQLKQSLQNLHKELSQKQSNQTQLKQKIQIVSSHVNFLKKSSFTLSSSKSFLNNHLQQIKGNIRVYCRIRPSFTPQPTFTYQLKQPFLLSISRQLRSFQSSNIQSDYQFIFDHIFDQNISQIQIFNEISQLIQSFIDGKNVCIFAYGQTGSGKTFTMQGKNQKIQGNQKNQQMKGIIPRSVQLIYKQLEKENGNKYNQNLDKLVELSISEIYLENCFNLLDKNKDKVKNLQFKPVNSKQQLQSLYLKALNNRKVAFTQCNSQSSRSHLITIIKIIHKINDQTKQSSLVLVDLAGSQRVNQSNVSNEALKQAQFINTSLTQLGKMIRELKQNDKGVLKNQKKSFRNSKLTYLLHPYLQKDSKALMFVNISPLVKDEGQSINSLKFASVARSCKLN